jgi:hypothetical protein
MDLLASRGCLYYLTGFLREGKLLLHSPFLLRGLYGYLLVST